MDFILLSAKHWHRGQKEPWLPSCWEAAALFQIAEDLHFARDQATGREKRGQAAFSLPAMQKIGKNLITTFQM